MDTYRKNLTLPIGTVSVESDGAAVTAVHFGPRPELGDSCPVIDRCAAELGAYFAGRRRDFTVPLAPAGTAFQQRVWALLREIPYGQTVTYGALAARAGNPKAARAVGMACNRNPIAILIPCHRVVGSTGRLTGYAGGLNVKQALLELEGAVWKN